MQKNLAIIAFSSGAFVTLIGMIKMLHPKLEDIQYVPLEEKLTVHLIHHTHDDVGWLKNVEEYFYGIDQENNGA
jgi:hypothetical protein